MAFALKKKFSKKDFNNFSPHFGSLSDLLHVKWIAQFTVAVVFFCQKVVYLFISHMTDGNDISCSRSEMKESGNLDQPANRTKTANPIRSVRVCYRNAHTHFVAVQLLRRQKCTIFSNFTAVRRGYAIATSRMSKTTSSILAFRRKSKNKKYTLPKDLRREKRFFQRIQ